MGQDSSHDESEPVYGNADVPVGEWVDIPKGMVAAPDTYVDGAGVLRSSVNHAIAVWHNGKRGAPPCPVRVTRPDEITYDPETGAPWCPECFKQNEEKKRLTEVFDESSNLGD